MGVDRVTRLLYYLHPQAAAGLSRASSSTQRLIDAGAEAEDMSTSRIFRPAPPLACSCILGSALRPTLRIRFETTSATAVVRRFRAILSLRLRWPGFWRFWNSQERDIYPPNKAKRTRETPEAVQPNY